jgi:hypothetical protein
MPFHGIFSVVYVEVVPFLPSFIWFVCRVNGGAEEWMAAKKRYP